MDLGLLLDMATAAGPDRAAIEDDAGRVLTTSRLHELAVDAAVAFRATGASRVAYLGPNETAFPVALFGAALAGLPFVPLNYRLADAQLAHAVADHDLVAVAAGGHASRLAGLGVRALIDPGDLLESPGPHGPAALPAVGPDDIALLLHTSGTTAAPKAAVLRHRHLAAYVIGTVELGASPPAEAVLVSVPPYHVAGVMNLLTNLYSGRRIVYLPSFDPTDWLELVRRAEVTHAMLVPTMLARVVATVGDATADVPSLRSLSYGGARMPRPVIERALRAFPGVGFTNAYGLTETSSTVTVLGPDDHRAAIASDDPAVRARLGSAGLPLPGVEIDVRDESGRTCPPGVVGEIHVRGEQVAGEYLGVEGAGQGWFATRDLGHRDDGGYLFVEGRADDTIIRGGENIAPAEVEEVVLAHAAVADCAVVGLDDEEWGQRIAAAVVLAPGSEVSTDELQAFARQRLRGSKTPDLVAVIEDLPYTDTGKLLRRTVRERLEALAGRQVAAGAGSGRRDESRYLR
jgi:acyl-CoA synthetase (AMP-forming)/AMP-acid ligase II